MSVPHERAKLHAWDNVEICGFGPAETHILEEDDDHIRRRSEALEERQQQCLCGRGVPVRFEL